MALSKIRSESVATGVIPEDKGKNLLINSEMQIAQRGSSVAMAHDGTTNAFLIDRWRFTFGGSHGQLDGTYAQVADHPLTANGKSLKWTTGTAESSYDASEYLYFVQIIEAQNLQQLQFGTSNAKAVTLSFYVKSSVTGTYAVNLYKAAASSRIINKTYTISSANQWEKKTITFPADTASGAEIPNSNGQGFYVCWHLAAGSSVKGNGSLNTWKNYAGLSDWADGQATNGVATTAGATWQISQCQLEVGDVASPAFEHEEISTTLSKCQRYYEVIKVANYFVTGNSYNTAQMNCAPMFYRTTKRASPTVTFPSIGTSSGTIGVTGSNAGYVTQGSTLRTYTTTDWFQIYNNSGDGFSGMTAGDVCQIYSYGYNDIKVESEL